MAVSNFVKSYKPVKTSKYRAVKCTIDGHKFDSKKEAMRYVVLKDALCKKIISNLSCQHKMDYFGTMGVKLFSYFADFRYYNIENNEWIYEDVKGVKTPVYKLKKKLIEDQYCVKITEI